MPGGPLSALYSLFSRSLILFSSWIETLKRKENRKEEKKGGTGKNKAMTTNRRA